MISNPHLRRPRPGRWIATGVMAAVALAAAGAPLDAPSAAASTGDPQPLMQVIVRRAEGTGEWADQAVRDAGGVVKQKLGVIDGFVAEVPESRLDQIRQSGGVEEVTPDGGIKLLSDEWQAGKDSNSMFKTNRLIDADAAWGLRDAAGRKVTGKGVGVALIDSGVVPVNGL